MPWFMHLHLKPHSLGITCSDDPRTIYTLCWFVHSAHCHESKRSLPAAQRWVGRGNDSSTHLGCNPYIPLQELRKQFQVISELRAETKALQSDNLKLYEKVRYMQSYREDSGHRPVTQLDPLPPPSGLPDSLNKYQTRYEEAMNPFEVFRGRVRNLFPSFVIQLNLVPGSIKSLSSTQSCRKRSTCFNAFDTWQPSRQSPFHLLCICSACHGLVHDVWLHQFLHSGSVTEAIQSMTCCTSIIKLLHIIFA
jgi:hypothetical protein